MLILYEALMFERKTYEMSQTKESRNVPCSLIQDFPSLTVCVWEREEGGRREEKEKTQLCRISFLFCVLQQRNYVSVKILIILTWLQQKKKGKSVNTLLSKCNMSPGMGTKMKQRIIWSRTKKGKKERMERRGEERRKNENEKERERQGQNNTVHFL